MQPTGEQLAALDLFTAGDDLAIEAGAGTGKTTTLLLIGDSTPRRGQYIAFNKAIVSEAQRKVPDSVNCSTAHGLAMAAVGRKYAHRLGAQRERSDTVADQLGLRGLTITALGNRKFLRPGYLAGLVMRSIGQFCNSADFEPSIQHVPYIEGIDPLDEGKRTYANNRRVAQHIEDALKKAWSDLQATDGSLRFSHDHYLKMWQLSEPKIWCDYILFDEAQDASPVMLDIVARQTHAQRVYVGDTCQPPGTMVTIVRQTSGRVRGASQTEQIRIEDLRPGDKVVSYDMRSGYLHRNGRPVTGITERPFAGELVTVTTTDGRQSRYTPNHFCIVRIGEALQGKHVVYVMRRGNDFRVGRTFGQHAKQGDRLGISIRGRQEGADAVWIIGVHDTPEAAAEHEQTAAWQYGLPTLTFRWTKGVLSQRALDRFWAANGNNYDWAKACLLAHGRDIEWPLWKFSDGNLLRRRPLRIRALNLIDGMLMLPATDEMLFQAFDRTFWQPITITSESYEGSVWSLNVEDHHTYIADGILTSNCQQIYEWRGAVNALASLENAQKAFLSQSFRFGPEIADAANMILAVLDAELRLVGAAPHISKLGPLDQPDAYLYRTNAAAFGKVLGLLAQGRRPYLVGGGQEILRFARAVEELQQRGSTTHPELACFSSWGEVLAYVADDEQGSELKLMVDLIVRFGTSTIRRVFEQMVDEKNADVVVSTAHKAKGREWNNVRLGDDFPDVSESDADWRLLYVAVTRARNVLDYFDCDPVAFLLPTPERQVS
jgi:hypothetical protein